MTLHLLFSARPETHQQVLQCLGPNDAIVLLEQALALTCQASVRYLARQQDKEHTGLSPDHVEWLSDSDWVQLTLTAERTLSWFD